MFHVLSYLELKVYQLSTGHFFTPHLKEQVMKSKCLLQFKQSMARGEFFFTDEKIFNIEEAFNRQNDHVYASTSQEPSEKVPRIQRGHHPASVIVWWGWAPFLWKPFRFPMRTQCWSLKTLNNTLFRNEHWSFQEDLALAHKENSTQEWLQRDFLDFITPGDWPFSSPDLNPMDYMRVGSAWRHDL